MPVKVYIKQVILDSAVELAKEIGLEKMSMRKLAKKLECSVTPIYDAFESKDDLIEEVFEEIVEENNSSSSYFERNKEILRYGVKHPILYRDIRKQSNKSHKKLNYYKDVISLMKSEERLKGFSDDELESLNFDILIYMNGLVERSIAETVGFQNIEHEYIIILEQVTELFILGYKAARDIEKTIGDIYIKF